MSFISDIGDSIQHGFEHLEQGVEEVGHGIADGVEGILTGDQKEIERAGHELVHGAGNIVLGVTESVTAVATGLTGGWLDRFQENVVHHFEKAADQVIYRAARSS